MTGIWVRLGFLEPPLRRREIAAPSFRIFNPVAQGEKFDPKGAYVGKYIPEIAALPDKFIHAPWRARRSTAGYPRPIVDLDQSRKRALAADAEMKSSAGDLELAVSND